MKFATSKRERDTCVILDVVRRFGPMSRVDIHDLTRLRPGTISMLVRDLLKRDSLREAGLSDNPTGRKQVLLRLNAESGYVLSIEFDADIVIAAILTLDARVKHLIKEPTQMSGGVNGLVGQLLGSAERVMYESRIDRSRLAGVAVADPGLVNSRDGISVASSTIDFWKDVPLKKLFAERYSAPFLLESNTRARTVAERMIGAGHMAEDMLYLDYGTGIGLGVVVEGRTLRGRSECAGEFGHTHVIEGGPPCKCGSFGCLEALIGAPAIGARVRTAMLDGGHSAALAMAGGVPDRITGYMVLEAARAGDKMCAAVAGDIERYLGLALANAINLFNPELVVLDKRLELAGGEFLDGVARVARRQALRQSTEGLEFRFARLGADAGVLGAALLLINEVFEIPALKLPKFMTEPRATRDLVAVKS
ncbi:MAG: ROK family protein [Bryobacteraceae bacterium]